jgi:hypothetical protein
MTNWYYYDQIGKKCGPVDSGTLKTLAQHGIITPATTIETDAGKSAKAGNISGLNFLQTFPTVPVPPVPLNQFESSFSGLSESGLNSNKPNDVPSHFVFIASCSFFAFIVVVMLAYVICIEIPRVMSSLESDDSQLVQKVNRNINGYNKIKMGMSYAEVIALVGSPSSEMVESGSEDYKIEMYTWQVGSFGANFNVTFVNGKVTAKAQLGL